MKPTNSYINKMMTKTIKYTRTFFYAARCSVCFKSFSVPMLSQFNFGEYLFASKSGISFANFNAFEESEISEMVDNLLSDSVCKVKLSETRKTEIKFMLLGSIADKDEKMSEFRNGQYFCPRCGSNRVRINEKKKITTSKIPNLSFGEFKSLTKEQRKVLIIELLTGLLS